MKSLIEITSSEDTFSATGRSARPAKVRGAVLSPEFALMHFFENPPHGWSEQKVIRHWPGIVCNKAGKVTKITVFGQDPHGVMRWNYLPESVRSLEASSNGLQGTLELSRLPWDLRKLDLSHNVLVGTLDLSMFPQSMHYINLGHNQLRGSLNLECLSPEMRFLELQHNGFHGEVNLNCLPRSMHHLGLSHNIELTGEVKMWKLPKGLWYNWVKTGIRAYPVNV